MLIIPLKDFLLGGDKQLRAFAKGGKQLLAVFVVWQAKYGNTTRTSDTDVIFLGNLLCLVTLDLNSMGVRELQNQHGVSRYIL